MAGIVCSSAGVADLKGDAFLLLEQENDDRFCRHAVLSEMEYLRVNWSSPGKERSLSKKSAEERTRQNV